MLAPSPTHSISSPTPALKERTWESPLGPLRIWVSARGLARLDFPGFNAAEADHWAVRYFGKNTAQAMPDEHVIDQTIVQLEGYFAGTRRSFDLPLDLHGTPFQLDVWRTLTSIPWGTTCAYRDIAMRIGRPAAIRAVGAANGANPISIIVPCHRLVGATGELRGYGGGLDRKAALLALEKCV